MSNVTELDIMRPHVSEHQRCHNCGHEQISVHRADVKIEWWSCEKCFEYACKAIETISE